MIRTPSEQTWRPIEFPRPNEAVVVSVGRNSSWEGSSCGNFGPVAWGAMYAGSVQGSTGTNEPMFRRGPVAVPWADCNQVPTLVGEDLGAIIRIDAESVMG